MIANPDYKVCSVTKGQVSSEGQFIWKKGIKAPLYFGLITNFCLLFLSRIKQSLFFQIKI